MFPSKTNFSNSIGELSRSTVAIFFGKTSQPWIHTMIVGSYLSNPSWNMAVQKYVCEKWSQSLHRLYNRHTGRARKGKGARFGDEWVSCVENPVGNLSINATTNPLSASPSLLNLHQLFHELSAFVPEIWSKASGILRSLPRRRMRDKIFIWRALSFQRETDPRQNFSNPDSSLLICRQMSKPSSVPRIHFLADLLWCQTT